MTTAVEQASHLSDIGFPEFTAKLVTDVFDALVSANMRQTDAYLSLIKEVGKELSVYINNTRDDIGGEEIMQFLSMLAPPENENEVSKLKVGALDDSIDANEVKEKLAVYENNTNINPVDIPGNIDQEAYDKILTAVANRIAANKYTLLQEMVKQGILRLVVENGLIETRMTFSSYNSKFYQSKSKDYNRKNFSVRAKAKTGGLVSLWCKASAATSYSSIKVSTAEKVDQDRSGSRVNIFGRVKINFKTDYLPLNQ